MSILKKEQTVEEITPQIRSANSIKSQTANTAQGLVRFWLNSFDRIWNNPRADAADILAEMGTDAGEIMELSAALVGLFAQILPDRVDDEWAQIQAKIAEKPATTTHPDGTVTID